MGRGSAGSGVSTYSSVLCGVAPSYSLSSGQRQVVQPHLFDVTPSPIAAFAGGLLASVAPSGTLAAAASSLAASPGKKATQGWGFVSWTFRSPPASARRSASRSSGPMREDGRARTSWWPCRGIPAGPRVAGCRLGACTGCGRMLGPSGSIRGEEMPSTTAGFPIDCRRAAGPN